MRKKLLLFIMAFFFPLFIGAQETKPLIRFSPFYTQGINIEETRFIESLIQAYLSEVGEVVNIFDDAPPSAADGTLPDPAASLLRAEAPDYVISGSIYLERDTRIFTLEIHSTGTKETSRSTSVHKTASDLALKARSLVESAFFAPGQPPVSPVSAETGEAAAENITESGIVGTWRGEPGIEMIRLQQGGRGTAFFSSGAQMSLVYTIENNTLKVKQNSPNRELFYYPLPYGVAKRLSAEAEPMRWELLLYSGRSRLKGVKISTEAKVVENTLTELLPGTKRESLWVRSGR